jgi:hypothetical protein
VNGFDDSGRLRERDNEADGDCYPEDGGALRDYEIAHGGGEAPEEDFAGEAVASVCSAAGGDAGRSEGQRRGATLQ